MLAEGKAGILVVAKLDRLSRSLLDFASIMERSQREGWSLVALDLGVDTTTAGGEMMANVMASFAQFERHLIGERTSAALQAAKQRGQRLGRPRQLTGKVIKRIARERAQGRTLGAIADGLNADRVPTLTVNEDLRRVFRALLPEALPDNGRIHLTSDRGRVKSAIKDSRAEERRWPDVHLL